jgi:hypothetical protein
MPQAGSVTLTGKDVIIINGQIITALASGDCVKVEFDNPIADLKLSKDGNAIYAMNYSGIRAKVTLRVVRGSTDDQTLNGLLQQQMNDFAAFVLMAGSFIKRLGDGKGGVGSEVYQLAGGIFERYPSAKMNTEADIEQSISEYTMLFRNNGRLMQ